MFQSNMFFSKEDMHYSLNTVHRQYIRGASDSGLVVLMSGHFASQCCCHLTSLLFYKKGHSMHSDTKTHMCTLHYLLQLHTALDVHMHTVNPHYAQSTCNPTNGDAYLTGSSHRMHTLLSYITPSHACSRLHQK